jgi:hypothetical protein
MASEENPNRTHGKLEMDQSDFDAMIREQLGESTRAEGAEPEADKPERSEADLQRKEPEVKVSEPVKEREPAVIESTEPSGRPSPTEQPEEVTRALSTISRLQQQVDMLEAERQARYAPARREPQVEVAEVIPGLTLPKDPNMWPVRLTSDMVKAAGLDPEVAPGLNILANAFLLHINNVLTPAILGQVDQGTRSRETANASMNAFYNKFPDLRDKQDLLELVEARARDTDRIHEKYAGADYMDQIGERTRRRIAALRGQSVEQYVAGLSTNAAPTTSAPSRATTSPARRAGRPAAPTNENQRELDDMLVKE